MMRNIKGSAHTPVEAKTSLKSVSLARIVDVVTEGPIKGPVNGLSSVYLDGTPLLDNAGNSNFSDIKVTFRPGTQTQSYIKGFAAVENEIPINVELRSSNTWEYSISNTNLDAVELHLSVLALSKADMTNGDINGHSVSYEIYLTTDDKTPERIIRTSFDGKTTNKYIRAHRIDLPKASTGWHLTVLRMTPNADSSSVADTTMIESVKEIIDSKLRYPNSALFAVQLNAKEFPNIPSRAYDLYGRIIRVPSNYNPETREYTGIWDGTFKQAWTDNPAWIYFDLVTHKRYGLGEYISDDLVDKWALYNIGRYCDGMVDDGNGGLEPRYTCNLYLQQRVDAFKVLQDLASVFRGIAYWAGGMITSVADMPQDPKYIYNNANVKEGVFSYEGSARKNRHTVALVSWNDVSDLGKAKVEYVEDAEGISRYGVQTVELTAIGCTSRSQARRLGLWTLLTERYETNTVTFTVGLDGSIAAPGQIIAVADEHRAGRRIGGRVRSATVRTISFDKAPEVAIGDYVTAITPSGEAERRGVIAVSDDSVTVSPDFSDVPVEQSVWMIESSTLVAQRYRVISVAENDEGSTYTIVALEHATGKFAEIENGVAWEKPPTSVLTPKVQAPPAEVTVTHREIANYVNSAVVLTVSWDRPAGAVEYEIEAQQNTGSWQNLGKTENDTFDVQDVRPGTFVARVSAINAHGVRSSFRLSEVYDVPDQLSPPQIIEGLQEESIVNHEAIVQEAKDRVDAILEEQTARAEALAKESNERKDQISKESEDRKLAIQQEAEERTAAIAVEVEDRKTAISKEIENRQTELQKEVANRKEAIADEVINRNAAIKVETDNRIASITAESDARAKALSDEAAARGAAITLEENARKEGDASLSDRIETVTAAVGDNTAAIQDETKARVEANQAEANKRSLLEAQLRGDYDGEDLNRVTSGLIAQERSARSTQYEGLAQQMTLLSAGVGEQFDCDAIWYFRDDAEDWKGSGPLQWKASWISPAEGNEPYLVSPLSTTGIVSGIEYNQIRVRVKKTGNPTWLGKLWWKKSADVEFFPLVLKTYSDSGSTFDAGTTDPVRVFLTNEWQGRVELSDEPRTDVTQTDLLGGEGRGVSVTESPEQVEGAPVIHRIQVTQTDPTHTGLRLALNTTKNTIYTDVMVLRLSEGCSDYVAMAGHNNGGAGVGFNLRNLTYQDNTDTGNVLNASIHKINDDFVRLAVTYKTASNDNKTTYLQPSRSMKDFISANGLFMDVVAFSTLEGELTAYQNYVPQGKTQTDYTRNGSSIELSVGLNEGDVLTISPDEQVWQLRDTDGVDVVDAVVDKVYQEDWQGRVELSKEERRNHAYSSSRVSAQGETPPTYNGTVIVDGQTCRSFTFDEESAYGGYSGSRLALSQISASLDPSVEVTFKLYFRLSRKLGSGERLKLYATPSSGNSPNVNITSESPAGVITSVEGSSVISEALSTGMIYLITPLDSPLTIDILGFQVVTGAVAGAYIPTSDSPVDIVDYTALPDGQILLGQRPSPNAKLSWIGSGTNADGKAVSTIVDGYHEPITFNEPSYDGNGIGVAIANTEWNEDVGQIKIQLTEEQSATDGMAIDWIAIGRPAPGASNAALANEATARASADMAEATARQTLSVKLVGTPNPNDVTIDNVASGLIFDEKHARVTADTAMASDISGISVRMPSGAGKLATSADVSSEATARAEADSALSTRADKVESRLPAGNDTLATSASVSNEAKARAEADSAISSDLSIVQATIGKTVSYYLGASGWAAQTPTGFQSGVYDVDGTSLTGALMSRGLNMVVFDGHDGSFKSFKGYDTRTDITLGDTLAADINAVSNRDIIAILSRDEPSKLTDALKSALISIGATSEILNQFEYRCAYILVGYRDLGEGNGVERYAGQKESDPNAWVEYQLQLVNGRPVGIAGMFPALAAIKAEATARTTADESIASDVSNIEARLPAGDGKVASQASLDEERQARTDGDSANTSKITALQTSVDGTARWQASYSVSTADPKKLTGSAGASPLDLNAPGGAVYQCEAQTTGTATRSSAVANFVSNGATWTLETIYEAGTSSNNPEFFIDDDGDPAVRLHSHTSHYVVQVQFERHGAMQTAERINSSAITKLDTRVSNAEGKLESQSESVTALESSLDRANDAINDVQDVADAAKNSASSNSTAINQLGTRVTKTEDQIASQAKNVLNLESSLATANENIDAAQTTADEAKSQASANSQAVESLTTDVKKNKDGITAQAESLNGLKSRIPAGSGQLATSAELEEQRLAMVDATTANARRAINLQAELGSRVVAQLDVVNGSPTDNTTDGWVSDEGTLLARNGYFYSKDASTLAHQDIDISSVDYPHDKPLKFRVSWLQGGFEGDDDAGTMGLEYLDAEGVVLASKEAELMTLTSFDLAPDYSDYLARKCELEKPKQAVTARLLIRLKRKGGADCNAYFVGIELSAVTDAPDSLASAIETTTAQVQQQGDDLTALSDTVRLNSARMPAGAGKLATSASVQEEHEAMVAATEATAQSVLDLQSRLAASTCYFLLAQGGNVSDKADAGIYQADGEKRAKGSASKGTRGNMLGVLNDDGTLQSFTSYDTYGDPQRAEDLAEALDALSDGTLIIVLSCDEPYKNLTSWENSLDSFGYQGSFEKAGDHGSWIFVGKKNDPSFTPVEIANPKSGVSGVSSWTKYILQLGKGNVLVGDSLSARLTQIDETHTDAEEALSKRTLALESRAPAGNGDLASQADLLAEQKTRADGDEALSSQMNTLDSRLGTAEASLVNELITRATKDAVIINQLNTIDGRLKDAESSVEASAKTVSGYDTRMSNAEGKIASQTTKFDQLTNTVNGLDDGIKATNRTLSNLDSKVERQGDDIKSQGSAITSLKSSINNKSQTFVQSTQPPVTDRVIGDEWVDTSNKNSRYYWNGTKWQSAPDNNKVTTFVQSTPPTALAEGDIWFKSDDNNRQYRWNGSSWTDMSDKRIAAAASAVNSLTSRVDKTEKDIKSQAEQMTQLDASIGTKAAASALDLLSTKVTKNGNDISAQATSYSKLNTTVNGNTSSITEQKAVVNGLKAQASFMLDTNGHITGWQLNNNSKSGSMAIVADKFSIVSSGKGARTEFSGGNWRIYDSNGKLRVRLGVW